MNLHIVAARSNRYALQPEKGQTLVEFALVLMLLMLLTFGMFDFCRAVYTASVIQAAAQAGARAGMISLAGVTPAAEDKLIGLDITKAQISTIMLTSERIEVQVAFQFEFVTPLIATLFSDGELELEASASMLID